MKTNLFFKSIFSIMAMLTMIFIFSSCSSAPSEDIVQTAIAKTQLASTAAPVATMIPTQDNEKQQIITEVIALFNIGTHDAYAKAYDDKLRVVGSATGKYWDDEEIQTLRSFALDMAYVKNGNSTISVFDGISPDYQGVYHKEIETAVLSYITREEWTRRYEESKPIRATVVAKLRLPIPQIGMTAQQVLDSQWGKPQDINKTTTANSISEQWVYGDGKYVYLENGIVVSIQE